LLPADFLCYKVQQELAFHKQQTNRQQGVSPWAEPAISRSLPICMTKECALAAAAAAAAAH
jgi:hypothetical protein